MARSITYWYDIIAAEKVTMSNLDGLTPINTDAQSLLSDITSTSRVARWRLWIWCVATGIYALEVLFDLFKIELEEIASRNRYGSIPWYVSISKGFQYGYNLQWIDNQYKYAINDSAARIIERAAAIEVAAPTTSLVIIKVAKLTAGAPAPLSSAEKTAFVNYIQQVKPAGIAINIISENADDLSISINVVYDALVLSATGESLLSSGVFPVEDAINNYISNLPFNGVLELCNLIDAIQSVNGVVSAYITNADARYGILPFAQFTERYSSNSGHMKIYSGTPLSSTITYVADGI